MRLGTIPVYVRDQDAALRWWTERLGFEVRMDVPMGPGQRWLEVAAPGDTVRIVLYMATPESPGATSFEDAQARLGTFTGYVFSTDDVRGDRKRLGDLGVTFTTEPDEQPWGTFASFVDQDGNGFGLMQPPSER